MTIPILDSKAVASVVKQLQETMCGDLAETLADIGSDDELNEVVGLAAIAALGVSPRDLDDDTIDALSNDVLRAVRKHVWS